MSVSNLWHDIEDIRRDLFEYSNLPYPGDSSTSTSGPPVPMSITQYRTRTTQVKNPGVFSAEYREDVEVFVSGRGRYIKDRILKPGEPAEYIPEDHSILGRKIREVSGLGYGNEIIEKAFVNKDSDMDIEKTDTSFNIDHTEIPNLKLVPTSASGNISPQIES